MVESYTDTPISLSPVIKAVSGGCNLRCNYCFYSGNQPEIKRMSVDTLEALTKHLLESPSKHFNFIWHGGEPMLLGIEFYEKALEAQTRYKRSDQDIRNSLQTNATLINQGWVDFFKRNSFGVGVSIDGPAELHDLVRVQTDGRGSYDQVVSGINQLKAANISFGGIAVVNRITVNHPETMFAFIKDGGIPMALNRCNANTDDPEEVRKLAVGPAEYNAFLLKIFDLWINENNPAIKIRPLDELVRATLGYHTESCSFLGQCERYFTVDFNGDVYPCDEFLNDRYLLGNIKRQAVNELWQGGDFRRYYLGRRGVIINCEGCEWMDVCNGGCIRDWEGSKGMFNPKEISFCEAKRSLFQTIKLRLSELGYTRGII